MDGNTEHVPPEQFLQASAPILRLPLPAALGWTGLDRASRQLAARLTSGLPTPARPF